VVAVLLYAFGLSLREARPLSPSGWALSDYARLEAECIRRSGWGRFSEAEPDFEAEPSWHPVVAVDS